MNEIKNLLGNIKTRVMSLSKTMRILIVSILAIMIIGIGAVEVLVGDDGPDFGDEKGIHKNFNGKGQEREDGDGGPGGEGGNKEGATRSLSSSFFQLGIVLIGISIIAIVVKPKKTTVIKQHVLGIDDEEIDND